MHVDDIGLHGFHDFPEPGSQCLHKAPVSEYRRPSQQPLRRHGPLEQPTVHLFLKPADMTLFWASQLIGLPSPITLSLQNRQGAKRVTTVPRNGFIEYMQYP